MGIALEHLGEVAEHALGNRLVLLGTLVTQVADALLGRLVDQRQLAQQQIALQVEHTGLLGFGQLLERTLISLAVGQPAATVATIVVDEERLIARRGGGKLRNIGIRAEGVSIMVAGRAVKVADNLLARCCGVQRHARDNRYDN